MPARLSKSRFLAGLQCRKYLWWQVHDPLESAGDASRVQLDRGLRVGLAARAFLPGGVLIDLPPHKIAERVAATEAALASKAPFIYEAGFMADDVFVAVDILERRRGGYGLIEVKSGLDLQEHHISDVAVQLHVLGRAGVEVKRVEVMHLNRDCRHPDLSNLFVRQNVTADAEKAARSAPRLLREFAKVLAGKMPAMDVGEHCHSPWPCPFTERCWPALPRHHVSSLYRINAKVREQLIGDGHDTLLKLPRTFVVKGIAKRQLDSVRSGKLVVEAGLGDALDELKGPLAFLDFETVAPAIPAWRGCHPYRMVPVQFSCHVAAAGGLEHRHWLAEGSEDPRPVFASKLIEACRGAKTILSYSASFEKSRIEDLMQSVPKLKTGLASVHERIQDLLPIVRNHVYHPDFNGSFSIKSVLPALVPGAGYDDLEIQDGGTASSILEAVLLDEKLPEKERAALRRDALAYCERDTLAMVKLFERLKHLAAPARDQ